jgi:hypothetical protein
MLAIIQLAKTMVTDTTRDYLVDSNLAQTTIKQLLSCGDAVVEIRTLETLVHMGNEAPRLYAIFEKHGTHLVIRLHYTRARAVQKVL